MQPNTLSDRQRQMCAYILLFVQDKGWAPSYRQMMLGLGMSSVSVVKHHLDKLVEGGFVYREQGERCMRLEPSGKLVARQEIARLEKVGAA